MRNSTSILFDRILVMINLTFSDNEETDPVPTAILQLFHVIMTGIWFLICVLGICTNVFNLRTYVVMGLDDSVTVSFFSLAISDFNICTLNFIEMVAFLVYILEREYNLFFYFPPIIPLLYLLCLRRVFNLTTILITTFLAVQRCLCVVIPFHVKGMFTRFRTVCFMAAILSFSTICYSLYTWRHEVVEMTSLVHNASQLSLYIPPGSEPYLFIMEVVIGIILNVICQVIVLACLVVMGLTLRKSAKFRRSATSQVNRNDEKTAASNSAVSKQKERANNKETQALIQVSLVSTIFVITNAPYLGFGIANLLIPEFGVNLEYHNLYYLCLNIMFTAELCNSSVNFFVYYRYNSKFRNCFPIGKKQNKL